MRSLIFLSLFYCRALAQVPSPTVEHNTVRLQLPDTAVEVEFLSASTIRVTRAAQLPKRRPATDKLVERTVSERAGLLRYDTGEVVVELNRKSGLLSIAVPAGLNVYTESLAEVKEGGSTLTLEIRPTERFYGFGPRPQAGIDARGLSLQAATPFFMSSRGYAFWLPDGGPVQFDVAKTSANRLRVESPKGGSLQYLFAFGPSTKEIWEERHKAMGPAELPPVKDFELISMPRIPVSATALPRPAAKGAELLCQETRALVHASLSGVLLPAFDLSRYRDAPDDVFRRALRLGTFSPIFYDSVPQPAADARTPWIEEARVFRRRLSLFLITYGDEARQRGYPMIHPLMMQFPRDPIAGTHIDEYMFGDEFLLAPSCDGAAKREVYLPMGNWTDWRTNQAYPGKRTVSVDVPDDGLVILAKNGAVVPLVGVQPGEPTELHYFPKNGGEAFILEREAGDYTQAHAGPAADIYRLEIESKVTRKYEWVVHHMDRPKAVAPVGGTPFSETQKPGPIQPGQWRYDAARRQLHVGVDAAKGSDIIVNVTF